MSTSTTASAAWAQGSNANADNTASTSSRPKRAAASRRSNNGQDNQQSLSPVPSTSTLSTRSKVFTRSESGRLESPDKLDTTLPAASASTSARSTRRNSRSAPEASDQKRINGTSIPAYDEDQPRPDVIIEGVAVANTAAPSLTPETAAHEPLPILHADAVTAGLKRKLPLDEDATSLLNGNGGSSYDVTPLTSPAEADIMLPAVGAKGDETLGSVAGPKRAPRKKRKWLKKGEGRSFLRMLDITRATLTICQSTPTTPLLLLSKRSDICSSTSESHLPILLSSVLVQAADCRAERAILLKTRWRPCEMAPTLHSSRCSKS